MCLVAQMVVQWGRVMIAYNIFALACAAVISFTKSSSAAWLGLNIALHFGWGKTGKIEERCPWVDPSR